MFHLFFGILTSAMYNDYKCQDLYPLYSTKTSYESITENSFNINECQAESIWMLIRNGARYPNPSEISTFKKLNVLQAEILENKDKYHVGEMCSAEIEQLRRWNFTIEEKQSMSVSDKGRDECFRIGNRLKYLFPDLFFEYGTIDMNIRVTSHKASSQSAEAFIYGLTESPFMLATDIYDEVLMNEKDCPAWSESIQSQKAMEEVLNMEQSDMMKTLLMDVKRRLGYTRKIEFEMVKLLYDYCGYESSWKYSNQSPWCPTITTEHLKIMEYYKDLMYYYKSGYGNPLTKNLGCSLLSDMITWLNSDVPRPTFNFGHLLAMQKLLVSLDIAGGDGPLKGDGYSKSSDRQWRTSYLNPYAANLMAVLYKCKKNGKEQKKVAFYLNECAIKLPACSNVLCDVDDFIKKFSPAIDPRVCNRDFCNLSK